MGGGTSRQKTVEPVSPGNDVNGNHPRRKPALPHFWSTAMDYEQGQVALVRKMLVEKLSLNHARSIDGLTPLVVACRDGFTSVVEALLEGNADVNFACQRVGGLFPLVTAAEMGHASIVEMLLRHRADVNRRTPDEGESALGAAARQGHVGCVVHLLDAQADVHIQTTDGATPLFEASSEGHTQVADVLLDAGSEVDMPLITNNSTPLIVAATMGHLDVVNALLAHEASTDLTVATCGHWEDVTALLSATTFGHTQVVKALLRGKADPDPIIPTVGITPLMAAAMSGHQSIVKVLLAQNANPHLSTTGRLWILKRCPNNHVMLQFSAQVEDGSCSVCKEPPSQHGNLVYSCVSCNYIVCPGCTDQITKKHKEVPTCVEPGVTASDLARIFGHKQLVSTLS